MVTEKDRKAMIRTLLSQGTWTKADFKAKLQAFVVQNQWEQTQQFVTDHWHELEELGQQLAAQEQGATEATGATGSSIRPFQEVLHNYERYEGQPLKLFSALARGRIYQGKFQRLLEDFGKPEWNAIYQQISEDVDEFTLIRNFAADFLQDFPPTKDREKTIKLVTTALQRNFPKAVPQPADGGKASGIQGEMDLMTYLQTVCLTELESKEPLAEFRILAPVMLVNQRKGRNPAKKTPFVIELPPEVDLTGKTTELDAMIVQLVSDDEIRVRQVWEAKATLNPVTIGDALRKKGKTLKYFSDHRAGDVLFNIAGKVYYSIPGDNPGSAFGIFGKKILGPQSGLERIQTSFAEALLERSVEDVQQALETGKVMVPQEDLVSELDRLLALSRQLQAKMVVRSELS